MGVGWAVFTGRVGDGAAHHHHAIQIALAHGKSLRVWTECKGWMNAAGVLIGADVRHRLAESTLPVTLIYLEGESSRVRGVYGLARECVEILPRKLVTKLLKVIKCGNSDDVGSHVARILNAGPVGHDRRAPTDPLILASLSTLSRPLPGRITLLQMAQASALSSSRYAHRFVAHTGMALRPYLRWLRLITAVEAVMRGERLTDAAHAAGFSDSAHFSRTFRKHFGIAPRLLLGFVPPERSR